MRRTLHTGGQLEDGIFIPSAQRTLLEEGESAVRNSKLVSFAYS